MDYDDYSEKRLTVQPNVQEDNERRFLLENIAHQNNPTKQCDRRINDGVVYQPGAPVGKVSKAHHSHRLLSPGYFFIHNSVYHAVKNRDVHEHHEKWEHPIH